MKWDLTGDRVNGLYMGLFPYSGLVTESRVKYGGDVQYTVQVDEPFVVFGSVRDVVLVSTTEINRILDAQDAWYDDRTELEIDYN